MNKQTKKGIFHSELSKMGPVTVTVKSAVIESKFKKGSFYVVLDVAGSERQYGCENDACADFFAGLHGRTFTLVAEGSRESAILTYVGESAENTPRFQQSAPAPARPPARPPSAPPVNPVAKPPPPPPPAPRHPIPQVQPLEEQLRKARQHANRLANVCLLSYSAALYVSEQVKVQFSRETSDGELQARAATIAIQLIRDGYHHSMPTGVLVLHQPEAAQPSDNDGGNV